MKTDENDDKLLFEVAIKLTEMLSRIVDCRSGFELAASHVGGDSPLGRLFERRAAERDEFAKQLQQAVANEGVRLREEKTLSQTWRTAKRTMKEIFTEHPPTEIVEECLRGERRALEDYSVVQQIPTVPAAVRELLSRQSEQVSRDIAELEQFGAVETARA